MSGFKRQQRYLTLKYADISRAYDDRAIVQRDLDDILRITEDIHAHRVSTGKPEFKAVVVEADWPEFERVWALIKVRETRAEKTTLIRKLKLKLAEWAGKIEFALIR